ncbi:MAG: hypothetical protein PHP09_03405 [Bacilli bacterium]|jgi:hypothetical protein|nr:hypothetical protein [Bacilli bacterium]MDD3389193.1 hypothetical protein [Bacilli bacterium]MDD4344966.1 hypothetical protein [Bacilli bacterium]MDY0399801.1 hypothetical protein [Bacilli bacterium]
MFDIMIKALVYAMWAGLILSPITLLTMRVFIVLKARLNGVKLWLALLLPFSYGIESLTGDNRLKKVYHILLIIFFVFLLLGSCFLFYQYKG